MYAYMYDAAWYCEPCAVDIAAEIHELGDERALNVLGEYDGDSGGFPVGPYPDGGGEADSPSHCDRCTTFLENPLTFAGDEYVAEELLDRLQTGAGEADVLHEWLDAYGGHLAETVGRVALQQLVELEL